MTSQRYKTILTNSIPCMAHFSSVTLYDELLNYNKNVYFINIIIHMGIY